MERSRQSRYVTRLAVRCASPQPRRSGLRVGTAVGTTAPSSGSSDTFSAIGDELLMMNRELAYRLLHPLREGDEVAPGVSLIAVEIERNERDFRRDAIRLVLSTKLKLDIRRKIENSQQRFAFVTTHFGVIIKHVGPRLPLNRKAVSEIRARLQENDVEPLIDELGPLDQAGQPPLPEVDLWLIPGHIGHIADLGFRALRVLREIDILYIEEGSRHSVEDIYDLFSLGPIPEVVDISTDPGAMEALLEAGHAEGKTMALFGNDEGAPGLCDPGWRVLQAEHNIEPDLVIKSISAGSALSTALMYLDRRESGFTFLGLFRNSGGDVPLFRVLAQCKREPVGPSLLCFAEGTDLNEEWEALGKAVSGLKGKLTLLMNLSKASECRYQFPLADIPGKPCDFIEPDDKVVLRIDFDERNGPRGIQEWIQKLMR